MSRKNLLSSLHSESKQEASVAPPPHPRPFLDAGKSKPMAAVTKTLGDLNDRSRRANEIERKLAEGQSVVELEADLIEPSFVQDRMEGDIDGLKASLREQGQQVPILVRPHPDQAGRYQVAFGHRRHRALRELKLPVRAVVRALSDEELVIAQGQENNEREDLSFIEKARFAARLRERFSREIIMSSLSIDKSTLSIMLQLVDALPLELIEAIGPAPGVGRPSWQQLSDLVAKTQDGGVDVVNHARSLAGLSSEERFKQTLAHLKPRRVERGLPDVMSTSDGDRLAQVKNSKSKLEITIDKKATPAFAAFVLNQLPALFEAHEAANQRKKEA
ncbi:plasmid partitioning protein RepB (plasmid) [Agrobacterium leguminum]|uniref:plasmid partitioning protein RepB n=1 Tax=Agrobacterium leguminum TaxID=2792015 RepID=UPI00272C159A|nr:plasmid partitioning protein RepB [Agrobacterium leguminum]WLE00882.1 plasmid partitioning protein RepB [Agrobacterium leguminum]